MTGTPYRVGALFRYPLKSAAGVRCDEVELDRYGVRDDRRWMMIDDAGRPLTQREHPPLALLRASPTEDGLAVRWTGPDAVPPFVVRRPDRTACRRAVTIWGDTVHLPVADAPASEWLSSALGREAHFAWMPEDVERPVNPRYARPQDRTTLTDGYPLHLIGAGSMADLNGRLET
ncbi:MAG: MOSC N-terminal beta barrel domain-containing protein, partial [Gemmatimonadales bacterium]